MARKAAKPTAEDIREVASGKGSARDKREVATYMNHPRIKGVRRKRKH